MPRRPEGWVPDHYEPEPNTGCWLWTGPIGHGGYPLQTWHGKTHKAHRLLYELHRGAIPHGLELDHLCRIRSCVNPEHLEAVTHAENIRRGSRARQTHCKRGHELSGDNLSQNHNGRCCLECKRILNKQYALERPDHKAQNNRRNREYYWRKKAAEMSN